VGYNSYVGESDIDQGAGSGVPYPYVYGAVRAVGVMKPNFDARTGQFMPPQLKIVGTGFWLRDRRAFVTCAHVVEKFLRGPITAVGMLMVGGNGVRYQQAGIAILDSVHDLAILRMLRADSPFLDAQMENALSVAERDLQIGDEVCYAGFPFGDQLLNSKHSPTYSEGVIGSEILEDTEPKLIQITGAIAGGYSGAPVVLKSAPERVVAVVSNSPSKEVGDASIFRGIHWKHVKALLDLVQS